MWSVVEDWRLLLRQDKLFAHSVVNRTLLHFRSRLNEDFR